MLAAMEEQHERPLENEPRAARSEPSPPDPERAADERLRRLRRARSEALGEVTGLSWLNRLVVGGPPAQDGPGSTMHVALADGSLTDAEFAQFLAAYYWGAQHQLGDVAPIGEPERGAHAWYREYIKSLIMQEDGPDGRRGILGRYLRSLALEPGEIPESAEAFVERAGRGYRADLGRALGYALAVEVESDFQLSLIALALTRRFPRATAETVLSDLRLDTGREAERAHALCGAIEVLLVSHEIVRADVEAGFVRAVADEREFMLGMYEELKGDDVATQVW